MSAAATRQAVSNTKSIHLLRALLREATYLPDAVARQYFRRYIVGRFKAYQPKQNATASFGVEALEKYRHRSFRRRQVSIINQRTVKQQHRATKSLHYLRRANQGELPCVQKVLYFAYGRIGRRKYALLEDLLKPDPVIDGYISAPAPLLGGPAPLQALYFSNKRYLQFFDAPKPGPKDKYTIGISDRYSRLRSVVKSQHQRGLSISRELKGHVFKTPIHNVWMRPMPIKRARNNVRRWYAETMTRLLPPIPSNEWDIINAMVRQEQHVSLAVRRSPGITLTAEPEQHENTNADALVDSLKLDKLSKADKPKGNPRPSAITPHFMRRLYSRVLQLCCKVVYDGERKQWIAVWGEAIQAINPKIYHAPADAALFEGVDATGRVPRKSRPETEDARKLQPRNEKGEYVRFPFFAEYLPVDNPMRQQLERWKQQRAEAGIVTEDGIFRGR